jgi:hypothetical protein
MPSNQPVKINSSIACPSLTLSFLSVREVCSLAAQTTSSDAVIGISAASSFT